jgi:nicotinamidase-related amidase
MNKSMFICVDCQNDFFDGGLLPVPNANSIRKNIKKLIEFARERKIPVIYTQDNHSPNDPELKIFPSHCISETYGQQNIKEAEIGIGEKVFTKNTYDVFTNKDFKEYINNNQVKDCYLFGLVGNICLEAAAIGLRKLDINVYIFENVTVWMDMDKGIFCEGPDNKELSVKRLHEVGCHLVQCKL